MKLIYGEGIIPRVLFKKIGNSVKTKSGLEIPADNDELPKAEIVLTVPQVEDILKVGDIVYYINGRDIGRCKYKGADHYISPVGNIVAIIGGTINIKS